MDNDDTPTTHPFQEAISLKLGEYLQTVDPDGRSVEHFAGWLTAPAEAPAE